MKDFIESGILKRTRNNTIKMVNYDMKFLNESHLDEILQLQDVVFYSLQNKELFVSDSRDFILNQVLKPGRGKAIGIFVADKLIAYRTIAYPGISDWNLGRELDIDESNLDKVVHLEATAVHPDYRGNRLQAKMLKHTINYVEGLGYHYIMSTVSPYNYPSLKSVIGSQLSIHSINLRDGIYGGKLRYLLLRDLKAIKKRLPKSIVKVKNKNISLQMKLLEAGYIGDSIERAGTNFEDFIIGYKKIN